MIGALSAFIAASSIILTIVVAIVNLWWDHRSADKAEAARQKGLPL